MSTIPGISNNLEIKLGNQNIFKGFKNCIIIGENLNPSSDFHLLINVSDIKIDKVMTQEEYDLLFPVLNALTIIINKKYDKI